MRTPRFVLVLAALATVAACSGSTTSSSNSSSSSSSSLDRSCPSVVRPPGPATTVPPGPSEIAAPSGATTSPPAPLPPGPKGGLEKLEGTTPMINLPSDFKRELNCEGIDLRNNYIGGAEAYDAVIATALAATVANTDGVGLAKRLPDVTRSGSKCGSYKDCIKLLAKGTTDLDYDGRSGNLELAGIGDPMSASYAIEQFGDNDHIDPSKTAYTTASAPASDDVGGPPIDVSRAGDGVLTIGTVLPLSGALAAPLAATVAGVRAAVGDINEHGGVLGHDVVLIEGDSGDESDLSVAMKTAEHEVQEGVDAIIGAPTDAQTAKIIDAVTSAGVLLISPTNHAQSLSTSPDHGLFFRTTPSDSMEGTLLGVLVADDDVPTVGLLVADDPYATGLADDFTRSFDDLGGERVTRVVYSPFAGGFDDVVDQVQAARPDGILVIGFGESSRILNEMVQRGIGPKDKRVYTVSANTNNTVGDNYEAGR